VNHLPTRRALLPRWTLALVSPQHDPSVSLRPQSLFLPLLISRQDKLFRQSPLPAFHPGGLPIPFWMERNLQGRLSRLGRRACAISFPQQFTGVGLLLFPPLPSLPSPRHVNFCCSSEVIDFIGFCRPAAFGLTPTPDPPPQTARTSSSSSLQAGTKE